MTMAAVSIRHVGICVADIERSFRFYTGALGFEALMGVTEVGAPFDTLIEQPGATLLVQQLRCGDVNIELLGFAGGEVAGSGERQPMNRRGFTHMTLMVDDIEATTQRIAEHGGSIEVADNVPSGTVFTIELPT